METRLPEAIKSQVGRLDVPVHDLAAVTSRGRRLRHRRTAAVAALTVLAVAGAGFMGVQLRDSRTDPDRGFAPVAPLVRADGLRAFARPGPGPVGDGMVSVGGRTFPADAMADLGTSASSTPYGLVFFGPDRQARLLRDDGSATALAPAPESPLRVTDPTSAFDAALPLVAWSVATDSGATIRMLNFETGGTSALDIMCGSCADVAVDGLDQGLVFVRTEDGTSVWDPLSEDGMAQIAGPRTRVVDVRNKVVLYDGPAPTFAGPVEDTWTFVPGALDSELSFDGEYVLRWSDGLKLTRPGTKPVELDVKNASSWTFDTDGSVLVMRGGPAAFQGSKSYLYDCEVPSGRCTEFATVPADQGSPTFIGNDP